MGCQEVHAASQRVISTSPAITEILFAIGAGDRVVGVTDYCNFPKKACLLPSIGGPLNPNTEKWIALKPDLIILQDDSVVLNKHAKVFKIPTLEVSVNNLENILRSIQVIADAMQTPKAGKQLADKIKIQINNLEITINVSYLLLTSPDTIIAIINNRNIKLRLTMRLSVCLILRDKKITVTSNIKIGGGTVITPKSNLKDGIANE